MMCRQFRGQFACVTDVGEASVNHFARGTESICRPGALPIRHLSCQLAGFIVWHRLLSTCSVLRVLSEDSDGEDDSVESHRDTN